MRKYQIFEYPFRAGEPIDINLDRNIDKGFDKVTDVMMMTSANHTENTNLVVKSPVTIDDKEVYPRRFDTHLLFPMKQNDLFTHFNQPVDIDNSKIEGRIESIAVPAKDGILKVVLVLEERADD